jgi:hypothetical protein
MTFDDLMKDDVKDVFLVEFSVEAIYQSSKGEVKKIQIQFFEDSLDKLETTYYHAWCKSDDVCNISKNDKLTIKNIQYGIVDFSIDEFEHGINLFLQKV